MRTTLARRDATAPKYQQLVDDILAALKAGELKPGDSLPSLKELKADQGLSRPTVEKAYAFLEQEGLVIRQHGSRVTICDLPQKNLHGIIGLKGEGFNYAGTSLYWSQILGGVKAAASRAGKHLLVMDSDADGVWEKIDGLIACDWNDPRNSVRLPYGLPVVSLLTRVSGVASVTADDCDGVRLATEHLISLGHRRIAYLHGYENAIASERMLGYREALAAAGIEVRPEWCRPLRGHYVVGTRFSSYARKNMLIWLREDWHRLGCTALLCHNDEAASGAIAAFRESGLAVPGDVSVVGFDGTQYCEMIQPTLTSVEVPLRDIGATGVELLMRQIEEDATVDEHRILKSKIHLRETTASPIGF